MTIELLHPTRRATRADRRSNKPFRSRRQPTARVRVAAGFVLFGDALPAATRAVIQIGGLAAAVVSGIALAEAC